MTGTATTCSFTDNSLVQSGIYTYVACELYEYEYGNVQGLYNASALLTINANHCDGAAHSFIGGWQGDDASPAQYFHNFSGVSWSVTDCGAAAYPPCSCAGYGTDLLNQTCFQGACGGATQSAACAASSSQGIFNQSTCGPPLSCSGAPFDCPSPGEICRRNNTGSWEWVQNTSGSLGVESNCTDGVDNDCDGLVDGADSDCSVPANLTGSVWDTSPGNCSWPVRGATVSIVAPPAGYLGSTDQNCWYRIVGIPSGVHSVSALKPGYRSATVMYVNFPGSTEVSLNFTLSNGSCQWCTDWEGRCSASCSNAPLCGPVIVPPECNGARPGSWAVNSTGDGYVLCCQGRQVKPLLSSPVAVSGCMPDLVQFTRIVNYMDQPITLKVYTWKPCSS
jgi:hypothetical protein